ncbi:MAG: metallophosphoesterase [Clostridia bacterium]|nr:metallophosphoesterase [Clostridia bacterium]
MKILHTADWHLASPMESKLTKEQAKQRRGELLSRFADMIHYAEENGIAAVLLCGDLSDSGVLPYEVQDYVLSLIAHSAGVQFFLIAGNHDPECETAIGGCLTRGRRAIPENLHVFEDGWKTFSVGEGVFVSGAALPREEEAVVLPTLAQDGYHIVMLHGQIVDSTGTWGGEACRIPLGAFRECGMDYLALGHDHAFRHRKLNARCTWCYCGSPEGRGFDECGEHGFVVLTLEGGVCRNAEFVQFAVRTLHDISLDVTDVPADSYATEQAIERCVSTIPERDLVRVTLVGVDEESGDRGLAYLAQRLAERFFYAEIVDKTEVRVDADAYKADVSLRGEFVRAVLADEALSEEERTEILRLGLSALAGEDFGVTGV